VGSVFLGYNVASIVIGSRYFEVAFCLDIQRSKGPRITGSGPLKIKAVSSFETYWCDCPMIQHHIPENWNRQLHLR